MAERIAQVRVDDIVQLAFGDRFGRDRLIELQRVDDLVTREGVHHELLLVQGRNFRRGRIIIEHALVEVDHFLNKRCLEMKSRIVDLALRITELQHQRLLVFPDHEE